MNDIADTVTISEEKRFPRFVHLWTLIGCKSEEDAINKSAFKEGMTLKIGKIRARKIEGYPECYEICAWINTEGKVHFREFI